MSTATKARAPKCSCGCGQASAETTRLRKASCSCGASIIRLSRTALSLVKAECAACGYELSPDCLLDRTCSHDERDADAAVAVLERRAHDAAVRDSTARHGKSHRETGSRYRCGDCQAIRAAHGPCKNCRSERPPVTSYLHPRAARVVGGDLPF